MTRVAVLGAGPAGLGAALELARRGHAVQVLEQHDDVGGNAGSFEFAGVRVDYGSHRLHPASDPAILALVRDLLGSDLLARPRHGRIRLLGRWIHFPLRPLDLALRMHPRFAAGVLTDMGRKLLAGGSARSDSDTFASVLERGLGATICREFYFPYARKIWGLEPGEISPIQAYKRVSAGSLGKLARRLLPLGAGTGARTPKGIFYYPRRGFGQISTALRDAALASGARLELGARVEGVELDAAGRHHVTWTRAGTTERVEVDHVWSTVPVTALVRLVRPAAPEAVHAAAARLELRAMLLVYLALDTDQFTEYDAHYFPEEGLPFTRVSEPKNYAALREPIGRTVLCAEIPCERGDALFTADDAALGARVREGLERAGLPVKCRVLDVAVRRLPAAYPIYRRGYEQHFACIDDWIDGLDGLLTFGRQGLYAHDNTHHALFMARAAVDSLRDGRLDREAWTRYREIFETHVVED